MKKTLKTIIKFLLPGILLLTACSNPGNSNSTPPVITPANEWVKFNSEDLTDYELFGNWKEEIKFSGTYIINGKNSLEELNSLSEPTTFLYSSKNKVFINPNTSNQKEIDKTRLFANFDLSEQEQFESIKKRFNLKNPNFSFSCKINKEKTAIHLEMAFAYSDENNNVNLKYTDYLTKTDNWKEYTVTDSDEWVFSIWDVIDDNRNFTSKVQGQQEDSDEVYYLFGDKQSNQFLYKTKNKTESIYIDREEFRDFFKNSYMKKINEFKTHFPNAYPNFSEKNIDFKFLINDDKTAIKTSTTINYEDAQSETEIKGTSYRYFHKPPAHYPSK